MNRERVHGIVQGRVQGVCFRMCACREAQRRDLTGWVRNRPDGNVETVAEGEPRDLAAFVSWCRKGPSMARVTNVSANYTSATGEFSEFRITY